MDAASPGHGGGYRYSGSGSGGSVRVAITGGGTLTGSGSIEANGVLCYYTNDTGGGGGGRVAILGYTGDAAMFPSLQARGGTCANGYHAGAPGTVYGLPQGATNPDVAIENHPSTGQESHRFFSAADLAGQTFNSLSLNGRGEATGSFPVVGDMTIKGRGMLLARPWSAAEPTMGRIAMSVGGRLTVEAGGDIYATGRGYAGGNAASGGVGTTHPGVTTGGATATTSNQIASGSYGGLGGNRGSATPSPVYGDLFAPAELGSGGASWGTGSGGAGGGAIDITAGSLTIDGSISANGASSPLPAHEGGSGSGGSINIQITGGDLEGAGNIYAVGGKCGNAGYNTAGGGGRVVVRGHTVSAGGNLPAGMGVHVYGGSCSNNTSYPGGSGTAVLWPAAQALGDLIVDNNGRIRSTDGTPLRAVGGGTWTAVTYLDASDVDHPNHGAIFAEAPHAYRAQAVGAQVEPKRVRQHRDWLAG